MLTIRRRIWANMQLLLACYNKCCSVIIKKRENYHHHYVSQMLKVVHSILVKHPSGCFFSIFFNVHMNYNTLSMSHKLYIMHMGKNKCCCGLYDRCKIMFKCLLIYIIV